MLKEKNEWFSCVSYGDAYHVEAHYVDKIVIIRVQFTFAMYRPMQTLLKNLFDFSDF